MVYYQNNLGDNHSTLLKNLRFQNLTSFQIEQQANILKFSERKGEGKQIDLNISTVMFVLKDILISEHKFDQICNF